MRPFLRMRKAMTWYGERRRTNRFVEKHLASASRLIALLLNAGKLPRAFLGRGKGKLWRSESEASTWSESRLEVGGERRTLCPACGGSGSSQKVFEGWTGEITTILKLLQDAVGRSKHEAQVLGLLLDFCKNHEPRDALGWTPLHIAAYHDNSHGTKVLTSMGLAECAFG